MASCLKIAGPRSEKHAEHHTHCMTIHILLRNRFPTDGERCRYSRALIPAGDLGRQWIYGQISCDVLGEAAGTGAPRCGEFAVGAWRA
jgi:hypothetical protein